jgi:peptidoglycan-associated lipoprotein
MKYSKIVSGLLAVLIFSGCSQVAPEVPVNGGSNVGDSDALSSQTVTIDEDNINGNGSSNISGNGSGLNSLNNPYNSSSDGFKSLYFDFGSYSITSNMQTVLNHDIQRAKQTSGKIKIEGNCDEFGTDEYNYALGLKRAKALKDAMVSQGVNPSRIVIFSYGESNPVCNNMSDECYQRNRRVDLKLVR